MDPNYHLNFPNIPGFHWRYDLSPPVHPTNLAIQDTRALENPAAMSTPTRGTDIWSQPGSTSLPSRKRDFDSAHLQPFDFQNKSRRTTPVRVPNGNRFMPSSAHSNASDRMVEVIDLTGYVLPVSIPFIYCILLIFAGMMTIQMPNSSLPRSKPRSGEITSSRMKRLRAISQIMTLSKALPPRSMPSLV